MPQTSTIHNLLSEPFICISFKQRRRYSAKPANPSVSFSVTRMIFFFLPLLLLAHSQSRFCPTRCYWGLTQLGSQMQTVPQVSGKDNNLTNLSSESKQPLTEQEKALYIDKYAPHTASEAARFPVTLIPRCISDPISIHVVDVISIKPESKKTPQNPLCRFFLSCLQ